MANQKISAMTAASTLIGTELVPVIQGGNNRRTTLQAVAALAGGSELAALAVDFSAYTAANDAAGPSTDVVTYTVPANTLTGVRALKIESMFEFDSAGAGNIGTWEIGVSLGGVLLASRAVPVLSSDLSASFFAGGYTKIQMTLQAGNSAAQQFNDGTIHEAYDYDSSGTWDPVRSFQFSGSSEAIYTSTVDMTSAQDLVVSVSPDGNGSANKTITHRYTRIMRLGA